MVVCHAALTAHSPICIRIAAPFAPRKKELARRHERRVDAQSGDSGEACCGAIGPVEKKEKNRQKETDRSVRGSRTPSSQSRLKGKEKLWFFEVQNGSTIDRRVWVRARDRKVLLRAKIVVVWE